MGFFPQKDWRDVYRRLSDGELLNRIRDGDEKATDYLMETYEPITLAFARKALFGKVEAVGKPGDYAHDALLLLWTRASTEGATVLNHDNDPIRAWLQKTVTFRLCNAERKERKHWREPDPGGDDAGQTESVLAQIIDPDAAAFAEKPAKDVLDVVEEVLATYPKAEAPLGDLVRRRLMEGASWKETAAVLHARYPHHDPAFQVDYVQKTYWDRVHKKPFYQKLREALIRYGYNS